MLPSSPVSISANAILELDSECKYSDQLQLQLANSVLKLGKYLSRSYDCLCDNICITNGDLIRENFRLAYSSECLWLLTIVLVNTGLKYNVYEKWIDSTRWRINVLVLAWKCKLLIIDLKFVSADFIEVK